MSTIYDGIVGMGSLSGLTTAQRMEALAKAAQGTAAAEETGEAAEAAGSAFGQIFKSLIQNVKDTDAEFTQAQYLLATGQLDNPAQLSLAAYKNEIAVSLLVQLRNRALDAYNELKNMNV